MLGLCIDCISRADGTRRWTNLMCVLFMFYLFIYFCHGRSVLLSLNIRFFHTKQNSMWKWPHKFKACMFWAGFRSVISYLPFYTFFPRPSRSWNEISRHFPCTIRWHKCSYNSGHISKISRERASHFHCRRGKQESCVHKSYILLPSDIIYISVHTYTHMLKTCLNEWIKCVIQWSRSYLAIKWTASC